MERGSCSGNRESSVGALSCFSINQPGSHSAFYASSISGKTQVARIAMPHTLEERQAPPAKSDYNEFCFHLKVQSADLFSVEMRMLRILLAAGSLRGDYKGHRKRLQGQDDQIECTSPSLLSSLRNSAICAFSCRSALNLWHHTEHVTMVTSFT